jgi:hypothetical protein
MLTRKIKGYSFEELSERKMRLLVEKFLVSRGWYPGESSSKKNAIDIEGTSGSQRWVVVIIKMEQADVQPVNSFISVLGEILQRMEAPNDKYSIAIPDTLPLNRLWKRLPLLAKERTGVTALFVSSSGSIREAIP